MQYRNRKFTTSLFLAISCLPSIALAGTAPPMVVVGPVAGGAGGAAQAVPTLSTNLLIALGVLLAVVGLRFLQQKGMLQKLLSLAVLGGGLVMGGLGIQQTKATSVTVSLESSACSGSTVSIDPSRGDGYDSSAVLYNNCESASIQVKSYDNYPCLPSAMIHQDAAPGDVVAAGDTAMLSYCPPPT